MPSKKKKYNARFPAGRIKKIMQTDEEVGKVAQAVPIIISRTLELFVESLLTKALRVTTTRNSKTLSPSHVKQCILAESRFDFLKDLVKNIPDVSAAEEKELLSGENSPNTSRFAELPSNSRSNAGPSAPTTPHTPTATEKDYDSSCSSNSDVPLNYALRGGKRQHSTIETTPTKMPAIERPERDIMDLTKKPQPAPTLAIVETRSQRTIPNFYQETLTDLVDVPEAPIEAKQPPVHSSVIQINPKYLAAMPSTSNSNNSNNSRTLVVNNNTDQSLKPMPKLVLDPSLNYSKRPPVSSPSVSSPLTPNPMYHVDLSNQKPLITAKTPTTPILNIDFTKNLSQPEIKFVETSPSVAGGKQQGARSGLVSSVGKSVTPLPPPKLRIDLSRPSTISRQISSQISCTAISDAATNRTPNSEIPMGKLSRPALFYKVNTDIDRSHSDHLEIDEDYDT